VCGTAIKMQQNKPNSTSVNNSNVLVVAILVCKKPTENVSHFCTSSLFFTKWCHSYLDVWSIWIPLLLETECWFLLVSSAQHNCNA